MKVGSTFPQTTIGTDPVFIRDYAQAIEGAGYDYLLAFEHVVGAHPSRFESPPFSFRPENSGTTYTYEAQWHEPLTLFSHLMAVTTTLEFVTSVLLLPQRQTVLVAKQVAELQLLSANRLRLAVGIGWNFTEYEALGVDWHTRAERIEEQIQVLRLLWSQPLVTFEGKFHTLDQVGINPLPQRMPEIWYASSARHVVLDRTARLADGWMPLLIPPEEPRMAVRRLRHHLQAQGRDISTFGIDARGTLAPQPGQSSLTPRSGAAVANAPYDPRRFVEAAKLWKSLGASHFLIGGGGATASETLARALEMRRIFSDEVGND